MLLPSVSAFAGTTATSLLGCTNSFTVKPVTQEELIVIMSKFPPKLTAGDDLIPSLLVHDCNYFINLANLDA